MILLLVTVGSEGTTGPTGQIGLGPPNAELSSSTQQALQVTEREKRKTAPPVGLPVPWECTDSSRLCYGWDTLSRPAAALKGWRSCPGKN